MFGQPRAIVALLAALSLGLLGWMLQRTPEAHGDSGEYLLTVEAFANHGTPDIRSQDVTALTTLATAPALKGNFGRLWHAVRRSRQGHWYTRTTSGLIRSPCCRPGSSWVRFAPGPWPRRR